MIRNFANEQGKGEQSKKSNSNKTLESNKVTNGSSVLKPLFLAIAQTLILCIDHSVFVLRITFAIKHGSMDECVCFWQPTGRVGYLA